MDQIEIQFNDFTNICRICFSHQELSPFEEELLNFYINLINNAEVSRC